MYANDPWSSHVKGRRKLKGKKARKQTKDVRRRKKERKKENRRRKREKEEDGKRRGSGIDKENRNVVEMCFKREGGDRSNNNGPFERDENDC